MTKSRTIADAGNTYSARGITRAWINFNGTGAVAIRDSENVSSLGDRGTGRYDVNLTNAMSDADFSVTGVAQNVPNTNYGWLFTYPDNTDFSASHLPVRASFAGTAAADAEHMLMQVIGDLA